MALRRGVVRGLGEALRGDPSGLARAGAIAAGLAATTAGFAVGTIRSHAFELPESQVAG